MHPLLSSLRAAFTPRDPSPLIRAAIAENEMAATHEWSVWPRLQGLDQQAVTANCSADGTAEYLEAGARIGLRDLLHIRRCDGSAVHACLQLLGLPSNADAVLYFVDLDGHVVSEHPGHTASAVPRLAVARSGLGAAGTNRRLFGSSGLARSGCEPLQAGDVVHVRACANPDGAGPGHACHRLSAWRFPPACWRACATSCGRARPRRPTLRRPGWARPLPTSPTPWGMRAIGRVTCCARRRGR